MSIFQNCDNLSQLVGYTLPDQSCGRIYVNKIKLLLFSQLNLLGTTVDIDGATDIVTVDAVALSSGTSVSVEFDRELAVLAWNKADESAFYDVSLTIPVGGLSKEVRHSLSFLAQACGLIAAVQDTKCQEYWMGAEYDEDTTQMKRYFANTGRMSGHDVSLGGGNDTVNTYVLTWKQCAEPLFMAQGILDTIA